MFPLLMTAGASRGPQLAGVSFAKQFAGVNAAQSITIAVPSGAQAGDLLVMLACAVVDSGVSSSTNIALPAGWTNAVNLGSTDPEAPSLRLMTRVMQPGDTSWNVTTTSSILLMGQVQAWRRCSTTLGNRQVTQATDDQADGIGSTTTGSALAAFAFFCDDANVSLAVTSTPAGMITAGTDLQQSGHSGRMWAGWERRLAGGATGVRDWAVTGNAFSVFVLQEIQR